MFSNIELGPFVRAAYSQDVETGIAIVIEREDGKGDLPQEIGSAHGRPLTVEDLRKWFAPVSQLQWTAYNDDQLGKLAHEMRLVAKQNGLALAVKLPVTSDRDAATAEAQLRAWADKLSNPSKS